jgi:hypothetical protein
MSYMTYTEYITDERQSKPLVWVQGQVKTPPFSSRARIQTGFLTRQLQLGADLAMPHSGPMATMGSNLHELRIKDAQRGEWRIFTPSSQTQS